MHLLEKNRAWAAGAVNQNPEFFRRHAEQQSPNYLWIGCADSRVPPNQMMDLGPGELFVHRNIANVVVHTDLNCLSVIQYAVEVLQVEHIIVCGHYGCGGVEAALRGKQFGLIDNWLRHIQDVYDKYRAELDSLDAPAQLRRLCELNVTEQVGHVAQTTMVQGAWARGQSLSVHGWVYSLEDGIIRDLKVALTGH